MLDETGGYTGIEQASPEDPGQISSLSASIAAEVSASDKPDANLSRFWICAQKRAWAKPRLYHYINHHNNHY